jgi:general stress protein CsbA
MLCARQFCDSVAQLTLVNPTINVLCGIRCLGCCCCCCCLKACIKAVQEIPPHIAMLYFPVILNCLFRIMCYDSDDKATARGATVAIFSILKRYTDSTTMIKIILSITVASMYSPLALLTNTFVGVSSLSLSLSLSLSPLALSLSRFALSVSGST